MATTHEAFRIALATHNVRTRTHAAGNDSHISFTRTDGALAGDEHVLAVVVLPGDGSLRLPHWLRTPGLLPTPERPRSCCASSARGWPVHSPAPNAPRGRSPRSALCPAAGMIAPRIGITLPTVAPMPQCTSGIAA